MKTTSLLILAVLAAGCASTADLKPYSRDGRARYFRFASPWGRQIMIDAGGDTRGRILLVREIDRPGGETISGILRMYVQHHPRRDGDVDRDLARTADIAVFCYPSVLGANLPKAFPDWRGRIEAHIATRWFALYPGHMPSNIASLNRDGL